MGNNTLHDIELCAGFRRLLPNDRHAPQSMTANFAKHTITAVAALPAHAGRCAPRPAQPGKGRIRQTVEGSY
ncbi:hypothetical protein HCX48_07340 [Rhodocyclus tenuis]|uniref:Transposase n=1 Tax=Rhodocyclus gracilis TaxID=2929842 RepID=A0ABX0WJF8_9RHOO|nr:hypothetical protein [Rhodocyclus gracilis]NJA89033.1 hypothetical protein [Rhodocyclus gracilis]